LVASITVFPASPPPRQLQRLERDFAGDREDHDVAKRRSFSERLDRRALMLRRPVRELGGIAGAERDLVTMLEESGAQCLRDHA
jgi:hypothetical protein